MSQFLAYIQYRRMVCFRRLEDPKEEGCVLELNRDMDYDQVRGWGGEGGGRLAGAGAGAGAGSSSVHRQPHHR